MDWNATPSAASTETLQQLIYELLDAHDDTARLAHDCGDDVRWAAHLDYLRQLQRLGRETLASTATSAVVPMAPAQGFATRHRAD